MCQSNIHRNRNQNKSETQNVGHSPLHTQACSVKRHYRRQASLSVCFLLIYSHCARPAGSETQQENWVEVKGRPVLAQPMTVIPGPGQWVATPLGKRLEGGRPVLCSLLSLPDFIPGKERDTQGKLVFTVVMSSLWGPLPIVSTWVKPSPKRPPLKPQKTEEISLQWVVSSRCSIGCCLVTLPFPSLFPPGRRGYYRKSQQTLVQKGIRILSYRCLVVSPFRFPKTQPC